MTRRRQPPERERLFLTTALANPALREIDAETTDPAQFGDVLQSAAFGVILGAPLAVAAYAAILLTGRENAPLWALVVFGLVSAAGVAIRAGQIADSRRGRQWATFDRQPGETVKAPDFVPVADSPRTLVLDFKLRPKVEQWARLVQAEEYRLAYPLWTGKGKVFSRGEYDMVRAALRSPALSYEADDQLTQRGRNAVGRWAVGSFQAREVHVLRGEG